jgi:hypothetical protein
MLICASNCANGPAFPIRLEKHLSNAMGCVSVFVRKCAVSSVVEHYLDTVGVTGSNPVSRTIFPIHWLHPFIDGCKQPRQKFDEAANSLQTHRR